MHYKSALFRLLIICSFLWKLRAHPWILRPDVLRGQRFPGNLLCYRHWENLFYDCMELPLYCFFFLYRLPDTHVQRRNRMKVDSCLTHGKQRSWTAWNGDGNKEQPLEIKLIKSLAHEEEGWKKSKEEHRRKRNSCCDSTKRRLKRYVFPMTTFVGFYAQHTHISEGASVEILGLTWLLPDIARESKKKKKKDTRVPALVLFCFIRVICPSSRNNYLEATVLVFLAYNKVF